MDYKDDDDKMKLREVLQHPGEIIPLLQMMVMAYRRKRKPQDPNLAWCWETLIKVSRSYVLVIQQLPEVLQDPICVNYLVLRGLDTLQDDMAIPAEKRVPLLLDYYNHIGDITWKPPCGYGQYVELIEEYPRVTKEFLKLNKQDQQFITDMCMRLGAEMTVFLKRDVLTVPDLDLYAFTNNGPVAICLTKLWVDRKFADPKLLDREDLSGHMAMFLGKINVIRDIKEDVLEDPPRIWWPKEIWGKYLKDLRDIIKPEYQKEALACLNDILTDALRHIEPCLQYMEMVWDEGVFKFCAVPELMSLATISVCYNNPKVFTGVVKMRRGETAKLFLSVTNMPALYKSFSAIAEEMEAKCVREDPNFALTVKRLQDVQALCKAGLAKSNGKVSAKGA
nr:squalene synthase-like 3 [Transformation vector pV1]QGM12289.1 squalene synthase-like 3 [Transformation vector pV2-P]QGM12292.1 squalene synthase-like 3 [Transformation vector pV2-U]